MKNRLAKQKPYNFQSAVFAFETHIHMHTQGEKTRAQESLETKSTFGREHINYMLHMVL